MEIGKSDKISSRTRPTSLFLMTVAPTNKTHTKSTSIWRTELEVKKYLKYQNRQQASYELQVMVVVIIVANVVMKSDGTS